MAWAGQGPLRFLAGEEGGGNDGEKAAVNSSSGSQGSFRVILVTHVEDGWNDGISMAPLHERLDILTSRCLPCWPFFQLDQFGVRGIAGGTYLAPGIPLLLPTPSPRRLGSPRPPLPASPPFQPCISEYMLLCLFELQLLKLFAF